MKKIILIAFLAAFSFAGEGKELYNSKCASCHGIDGERSYMNKIRPVVMIDSDERLKTLLSYKDSHSLDKYGYGAVMRLPLKVIKHKDLEKINEYISEELSK
jgi:cytochrome c553